MLLGKLCFCAVPVAHGAEAVQEFVLVSVLV